MSIEDRIETLPKYGILYGEYATFPPGSSLGSTGTLHKADLDLEALHNLVVQNANLRKQVEILTAMGEHYADKDIWIKFVKGSKGPNDVYCNGNHNGYDIAQTALDAAKELK